MRRCAPSLERTAHGKGASALVRIERPPVEEFGPLNAADTAHGLALAKRRGRPFVAGNAAAVGRKPSLCLLGVPLEGSDPRYRAAMRKANAYRQRRVREIAVSHGGVVGAGPCAMLAAAARAMAASIVLHELAGEALATGANDDATKLFVAAAQLADKARGQELTAEALADRDAKARARAVGPIDPLAAFMTDGDT